MRRSFAQELVAAWGVKEALRLLLSSANPASVQDRRAFFERQVTAAGMKESDRLMAPVTKWWPEIQTLLATRVTTAKVEAANTMIKNIKRTARGFRNPINYQARILLRRWHEFISAGRYSPRTAKKRLLGCPSCR